ncbi:MAG: 50S ribosomal protein L3 [Planctomycetes bacterium]|nr:50S ribosomal protein L3 [Planctomycetota bacterium]MCA8936199.1 50S ribosomal protein L3 [Planctomycetota bacterium]
MSVKMLLGKKREMSQIFKEDGQVLPVTILELGPCTVAQVKTTETDGYNAVQLGFGDIKLTRVKKPLKGHWGKAGSAPRRTLKEARLDAAPELKSGDVVKVADVFAEGEFIDVIGKSKGRGFQGGIKRHGFNSGPRSHGTKNTREMGSTGAATTMARVLKGTRMPGQIGNERITVRNLRVARVDSDNNLLYVVGAVPGYNGADIVVRKAKAKRVAKADRALRKGK